MKPTVERETVLREIRELINRLGRRPKMDEWQFAYHHSTRAANQYGPWDELNAEAERMVAPKVSKAGKGERVCPVCKRALPLSNFIKNVVTGLRREKCQKCSLKTALDDNVKVGKKKGKAETVELPDGDVPVVFARRDAKRVAVMER